MSQGWISLPLTELAFALELADISTSVDGAPADPFDGWATVVSLFDLDAISQEITSRVDWEYDALLAA